jgi:hypothetical protein
MKMKLLKVMCQQYMCIGSVKPFFIYELSLYPPSPGPPSAPAPQVIKSQELRLNVINSFLHHINIYSEAI